MTNSDRENFYETLGLPPNATLDQVKSRFKELNQAYLKILELSRTANTGTPVQPKQQSNAKQGSPSPPEMHTEPIATIKERLAKGKINQAQFEKLAKERYEYLKNKPFSELSDSELEERLKGFEGLKIYPKYLK
jgi:hypothetical protein